MTHKISLQRIVNKIAIMLFICLISSCLCNFGYSQTTTIILIRHAEKDTTAPGSTMMKADPPLSIAGIKRAERLPDILKDYQPDSIYTTNYVRTKATIEPLAKKYKITPILYDPKELGSLAEKLIHSNGKTVVVAGHSNTTPMLVNLILKENKYANLEDSVYNQFWIITITNGKLADKIVRY